MLSSQHDVAVTSASSFAIATEKRPWLAALWLVFDSVFLMLLNFGMLTLLNYAG